MDRIADPDTEVVSDMQEMLSAIPLEFATAIQEQRWGDVLKLIPSTLLEFRLKSSFSRNDHATEVLT